MNERETQPSDQRPAQDQKQPYERPKLVRHGNVESQTHMPQTGPSGPLTPA